VFFPVPKVFLANNLKYYKRFFIGLAEWWADAYTDSRPCVPTEINEATSRQTRRKRRSCVAERDRAMDQSGRR
jgi:hypothetical protein